MTSNSTINELIDVHQKIYLFLQSNKQELEYIRESKFISADQIIDFSRQITLTLHAPKGWRDGNQMVNGHPPAPQPYEMLNGALQRFNVYYNNQKSQIESNNSTNVDTLSAFKIATLKSIVPKSEEKTKDLLKSEVTILNNETHYVDESTTEGEIIDMKSDEKSHIIGIDDKIVVLQKTITNATVLPTSDSKSQIEPPLKKARQLNISFGLSDSESSDDED